VAPTNFMKMRFVAADEGDGSVVEAAVDDFTLLDFNGAVAVGDGDAGAALALGPGFPNPLRGGTQLAYSLPRAGAVTLRIYDVNGRARRTLEDGARSAGAHRIAWDGRDDAGRTLPSGSYFARLDFAGAHATRTLVLIR
jgi:flagellar hook assembly protein FlgD